MVTSAARKQVRDEVAVRVETAVLIDVAVVVSDRDRVVLLRPADTLDAERELLTFSEESRSRRLVPIGSCRSCKFPVNPRSEGGRGGARPGTYLTTRIARWIAGTWYPRASPGKLVL